MTKLEQAAPEAFLKSVIALCSHRGYSPANIEVWDKDDKWIADLWRQAEAMLAASPTAEQQAAPKAAPEVGNSGFDHKTAADLLNNKTVSDEAVRKFVAASRWAHDERAALSATLLAMHGVLTSREAEIALLKKTLMEAEAAPRQEPAPSAAVFGWRLVPVEPTDQMVQAAHHIDLSYMPGQEGADRAAIYRAMIAAAPQPAVQQWNDLIGKETHADADGLLVWRDEVDFAIPTPPAEQQAPKETLGGVNGWRDISTAPKDGSRFVAIGYNYGLYSEGRHICVAQWFRGCWLEASDWNEASELTHLTHWLPLPSPPDNAAELNDLDVSVSPQQAATKAAPGEPYQDSTPHLSVGDSSFESWFGSYCPANKGDKQRARDAYAAGMGDPLVRAAPQQEALEPVMIYHGRCTIDCGEHGHHDVEMLRMIPAGSKLYTAPQPAPAPLSDDAKDAARYRWLRDTSNAADPSHMIALHIRDEQNDASLSGIDAAIDAAIAAQGGRT